MDSILVSSASTFHLKSDRKHTFVNKRKKALPLKNNGMDLKISKSSLLGGFSSSREAGFSWTAPVLTLSCPCDYSTWTMFVGAGRNAGQICGWQCKKKNPGPVPKSRVMLDIFDPHVAPEVQKVAGTRHRDGFLQDVAAVEWADSVFGRSDSVASLQERHSQRRVLYLNCFMIC